MVAGASSTANGVSLLGACLKSGWLDQVEFDSIDVFWEQVLDFVVSFLFHRRIYVLNLITFF